MPLHRAIKEQEIAEYTAIINGACIVLPVPYMSEKVAFVVSSPPTYSRHGSVDESKPEIVYISFSPDAFNVNI
jgi:hypothetical protein